MRKRLLILVVAFVVLAAALALGVRMALGGDRIKAAIEAQASLALGHPVTIRTAVPRLFPRVGLDLTGVTIGSPSTVTVENVRVSTGLRALIRRRVEDADVSIERSQIDVRWAMALLTAAADTPSAASPRSASAFNVDSVGSIALRDVTLAAGARRLLVDLAGSFTGGDRLVVTKMSAASDGSRFTASGELASLSKRTGSFTVDAQTLDLDGLLAFLAAATPAGSRQTAPAGSPGMPPADRVPLDIGVTVRSRQGRAIGITFDDLQTTARVKGSDVVLEDLRLGMFGGRYSGSAGYRGSAREGRCEWQGTFENIDASQLAAFAGAAGAINGRLAGTVSLSAVGTDPMQAIRRARGSARVAVTDGRIPGLEIVRSAILAFGRPTGDRPAGSGEAFTRVAATLAIDGPQISTSDLRFESRDFDMNGAGDLSLASTAIDVRADVVLSRELSAQAGRDLYRLARDGDRIVLPATIGGTAASPTVFIDVQAALKRALRNRAEDQLKGLFDRFRKKVIR